MEITTADLLAEIGALYVENKRLRALLADRPAGDAAPPVTPDDPEDRGARLRAVGQGHDAS